MRHAIQDKAALAAPPAARAGRYDAPTARVERQSVQDSAEPDWDAPQGVFAPPPTRNREELAERKRFLELTIRQRIDTRLPGRVRNLVVRALGGRVLLDGECSTYYTKQLAQHAALGVLDHDEHLENLILVNVPR